MLRGVVTGAEATEGDGSDCGRVEADRRCRGARRSPEHRSQLGPGPCLQAVRGAAPASRECRTAVSVGRSQGEEVADPGEGAGGYRQGARATEPEGGPSDRSAVPSGQIGEVDSEGPSKSVE